MKNKPRSDLFPMVAEVISIEDITLAQAVLLCDILSFARAGRGYWKSRKEIGSLLKLKGSAVTALISKLVDLGYITRAPQDGENGRRWVITLTARFLEEVGADPLPPARQYPTATAADPLPPARQYGDNNIVSHREYQESTACAREGIENDPYRDDIENGIVSAPPVPQDIIDSTVQLIGGTIAGPVYSQLAECISVYGEGWVRRAVQIARERDGRSIRYVVGILRSWKRSGYDGDARSATARRRAEAEEKRKAEADYYNRLANKNLSKAMERWEREANGQENDRAAGKHQTKRDDWSGDGGGDPEVPLQTVPRARLHLYQA